MLVQIETELKGVKIEGYQLTKNTVILCETKELVKAWTELLLNLKKYDEKDESVMLGFEYFRTGNTLVKGEFDNYLSKLNVMAFKNGVIIRFPDESIQTFYISDKIDIVNQCSSAWDLWFQSVNNFISLKEYRGTQERYETDFESSKNKLIRDIKIGRFHFTLNLEEIVNE